MNDCIYRQAAIDIADDLRDCISVKGYWAWTERLKKLPPAQAEIIWCKDCKYREKGKPIADGRYWCEIHNSFMYYCSDAERREGE